jgi:hypothetical protein
MGLSAPQPLDVRASSFQNPAGVSAGRWFYQGHGGEQRVVAYQDKRETDMNPTLSFYTGVSDATSRQTTTLHDAIQNIQAGRWREGIEKHRAALATSDERKAKQFKSSLPAFTAAGVFSYRDSGHLSCYSGVVCVDIDKVGADRAEEIRATAQSDPHVLAAFISPSGNGVKIFFHVTTGEHHHAAAWAFAAQHVRRCYADFLGAGRVTDEAIDAKVADLPRLCFVSYDAGAFYKSDALPLHVRNVPIAPVRGTNLLAGDGDVIDGTALDHLPASDITLDDVADMLAVLDASMGRSGWLEIAAALRHQFGNEPEASQAYELFDRWSAGGRNYVDADDTRKTWDSLKAVPQGRTPVTIRTLIKKAQYAGWSQARSGVEKARAWLSAQTRTVEELLRDGPPRIAEAKPSKALLSELSDLLRARLKEQGVNIAARTIREQVQEAFNAACKKQPIPLPPWARELVYVAGENKFYNTGTGQGLLPDAVDHMFKRFMPDADIPPHEFILIRCNLPRVDVKAYDPGEPSIFTDDKGRTCMNTYRRTYADPDQLNASRAGELLQRHLKLLIAEPEHQRTLMDFMAYIVQKPGKKVLWAPVIQGVQGSGKSTLGVVMAAVLGRSNVRTLEAGSTLKSIFNGFATFQLIVFDETRIVGSNPRELLEKLKPLIADAWVNVNRKFIEADDEKNVGNYMFFTNHHDALPIDENERRFFVLRSSLQTRADIVAGGLETHCKELYGLLEFHPGAFRAFLETWQISEAFNPHGHAPETEYKREMVRAAESWLRSAVRTCFEESESPSLASDLFSFGELKNRLPVTAGQRVTDQALTAVLNELGFRRIGRFTIAGAKLNLWTSGKWASAAQEEVRAAYEGLLLADELLSSVDSVFG